MYWRGVLCECVLATWPELGTSIVACGAAVPYRMFSCRVHVQCIMSVLRSDVTKHYLCKTLGAVA